jgi:NAD(P)-dependent dehydrogenase (short-subunit alcohol dehydrogenase family)
VLITGASSGIGSACALGLDARGWRVFAGVRSEQAAEALRAAASDRLCPLLVDLTNESHIAAAAERIAREVGDRGLDALINNAGIVVAGPLEYLPLADFRAQLEVNVTGQLAVTQAMLKLLRAARGRVLMMSSVSGRIAFPVIGPYAASKFALEALADSLRVELWSSGVSVAVIEPGPIATPIMERSIQATEARFENVSPEMMSTYGSLLEATKASVLESDARALPPEAVVRTVLHALTAKRCRTRYVVMRGGWLFRLATSLMPDRVRDAVILRALARHRRGR